MARIRKQSSVVWIGIVLAASLILSLFFPTPIVVLIVWAVFIYISLVLHKLLLEEHKNLYNTNSDSSDDKAIESSVISYSCMTCGENHNDKSCPVCGSKIKKAIF